MTSVIDNDTLQGLPSMGTDIGSFLGNLAPGVGAFIIIMGVFGGVAAIIYSIVFVIRKKIKVWTHFDLIPIRGGIPLVFFFTFLNQLKEQGK